MNMSAPLTTLCDSLEADRATLLAAVQRVPAPLRSRKPAPDRWSVANVLEHLAIVESRALVLARGLIETAPPLGGNGCDAPTPINRAMLQDRSARVQAPGPIQPKGTLSADEALAALERSRAELMTVIAAAEGRDLRQVSRPHPVLGILDGYQWLGSIGGHEERHALQILEIADAIAVQDRSSATS